MTTLESAGFLKLVLDAVTEHIVVIDRTGTIVFQNRAWADFGRENNCLIKGDWHRINYLDVCKASAVMGDEFGQEAADGIRSVINAEQELFYLEYPCHSPDEKRWFMMSVTPLSHEAEGYFVISHQNITERKLAEERALSLSRIDGLTNIANRRHFDEFLATEWRRCRRLGLPVSLAILDLDHFKELNDHYGHQAGDDCLVKLGEVINRLGNRPGDLYARYGGEEFVFVFGNTTLDQAMVVIRQLKDAVETLKIPNEKSGASPRVTFSVGLATMIPTASGTEVDLIEAADKLLYAAKKAGRNRIVSSENSHAPAMVLLDRVGTTTKGGSTT